MEQTIVLPIALGSKVYAVSRKFNSESGQYEEPKISNLTVTGILLFRNGTVRHYISGNRNYLPKNIFATKEEAESNAASTEVFHW